MQFDNVAKLIHEIDPAIEIQHAVGNEDGEFSFKEEVNYNAFVAKQIEGLEFTVSQDKRDTVVEALQNRIGSNFIVYFSEQNFGHGDDEITILATPDKYDALRFEATNGINYDIYVEDIIDHLKQLESENPFILTGIGYDFVQGLFSQPPKNIEQLAQEMYEFCPDIVDQGTETVEELASEIRKTNSLYYWWD